ncbi:MAG: hypothetical protein VKL42_01725 [Snowella sp.]|nr:hypothetical protein [Snowella sp.]
MKKLNESTIANELSEGSAFFPKDASKHVDNSPDKSTSKQVDNVPEQNLNVSFELKREQTTSKIRFTTYLRPDTIKRIKVKALMEDKDIYDVSQQIFDNYFTAQENEIL